MRARHAFASHRSIAAADESQLSIDGTDRPVLVRRNSTSTHSVASSDIDVDVPPPISDPPFAQPTIEPDVTDPARPQSVKEPVLDADLDAYEHLRKARDSGDYSRVLAEVERYRAQPRVSVPCYNMAMQALLSTRAAGQPITFILELYNEMLARSLLPNLRTYKIVINALCTRDAEIHRVIVTLENRISRRTYAGRVDVSASTVDQQRIAQLRAENNFASAITLFQAATAIRNQSLGLPEYNVLLRSCAWHSNVDAAIRVYAHMERFPDERPSATTFTMLITVYCNVADIEGAQEVFNEFKEASRKGRIVWDGRDDIPADQLSTSGRPLVARSSQIMVWNKMIDTYFKCGEPAAALGLLETMLDTARGQDFGEADVPLPNSVTYTSIINGFCESGDWQSALSWFDRLLVQPHAAANPYEPLSTPARPDQIAWITMLDTLARHGAIDDLNRIFAKMRQIASEDRLQLRTIDRYSVFRANLDAMHVSGIDPARKDSLLDFVLNEILAFDNPNGALALTTAAARNMLIEVVQLLRSRDDTDRAVDIIEQYVSSERKTLKVAEAEGSFQGPQVLYHNKGLRGMMQTISGILLGWNNMTAEMAPRTLPVKTALRVAALCEQVSLQPQSTVSPWYIHSYLESKNVEAQSLVLSNSDWRLLLKAYVATELPPMDQGSPEAIVDGVPPPPNFVFPGLVSLLTDLVRADVDLRLFDIPLQRKLTKALVYTHGRDEAGRILRELGPQYAALLDLRGAGLASHGTGLQVGHSIPDQEPHSGVHVDLYHSRFVEEWFPINSTVSPQVAYERFESGARQGIYPSPECLGRLIGCLGRLSELEKVRTLYEAAQRVLAALGDQKRWQSAGWFIVEDQMIIAFAHAGEFDAAHVHRIRILEQGGTPSADAYGALISSVKDTTDDTSNAMQLWEEALARDVRPNLFMYNTIISKLAKARKADHALEIFRRMKTEGVRTSSVTYGALIAACCRVGDAQSAEHLFHEMSTSYNFKPRVPPYNTMIQLYTYTKPDRERVLHYYNAMRIANIKPSAHTYKVMVCFISRYCCSTPLAPPRSLWHHPACGYGLHGRRLPAYHRKR